MESFLLILVGCVLQATLVLGGVTADGCLPQVCPHRCACDASEIDCEGVGLQRLPPLLDVCAVELKLKQNSIAYIRKGDLTGSWRLEELELQKNGLRGIAPRALALLSNLKVLHLEDNKLMTVAEETFGGLSGLEELYLQRNSLMGIEQGAFAKMPRLTTLILDNNRLRWLNTRSLLPPMKVIPFRQLSIANNPYDCSPTIACALQHTLTMLQLTAAVKRADSINCYSPELLRGKQLMRLNLSKLGCAGRRGEEKARPQHKTPSAPASASKTKTPRSRSNKSLIGAILGCIFVLISLAMLLALLHQCRTKRSLLGQKRMARTQAARDLQVHHRVPSHVCLPAKFQSKDASRDLYSPGGQVFTTLLHKSAPTSVTTLNDTDSGVYMDMASSPPQQSIMVAQEKRNVGKKRVSFADNFGRKLVRILSITSVSSTSTADANARKSGQACSTVTTQLQPAFSAHKLNYKTVPTFSPQHDSSSGSSCIPLSGRNSLQKGADTDGLLETNTSNSKALELPHVEV